MCLLCSSEKELDQRLHWTIISIWWNSWTKHVIWTKEKLCAPSSYGHFVHPFNWLGLTNIHTPRLLPLHHITTSWLTHDSFGNHCVVSFLFFLFLPCSWPNSSVIKVKSLTESTHSGVVTIDAPRRQHSTRWWEELKCQEVVTYFPTCILWLRCTWLF